MAVLAPTLDRCSPEEDVQGAALQTGIPRLVRKKPCPAVFFGISTPRAALQVGSILLVLSVIGYTSCPAGM